MIQPQDQLGICKIHNQIEEQLNPNEFNQSQIFVCMECMKQTDGKIVVQEISQSNKEIIQMFEKQCKQNSLVLNNMITYLQQVEQDFIGFIKIIQSLVDQIKKEIIQNEIEIEKLTNTEQLIDDIKIQHQTYLEKQKHLQIITKQGLEILKTYEGIDKLLETLDQLNLNSFEKSKENETQIEIQKPLVHKNHYIYELQYQPLKQEEWCSALAFNLNGTVMMAGCTKHLRVFELQNEQLRLIQQLEGHQNFITTIKYRKKYNQFVSGSSDGQIKIWDENIYNEWINISTLSEHNNYINSILFNSNEDLLISGGDDSIKFWISNDKEWRIIQSINCSSKLFSLSLNHSNTKLVSSEQNKHIIIYEQIDNKWVFTQKIDVQEYGFRLCFINDDEFAFLLCGYNITNCYKYNQQDLSFQMSYEVKLEDSSGDTYGFPIKYIETKNILIIKNGNYINMLRKQENNQFIMVQGMELKSDFSYGNVSDDGQYLITWDSESKEFQIRKLKEIN